MPIHSFHVCFPVTGAELSTEYILFTLSPFMKNFANLWFNPIKNDWVESFYYLSDPAINKEGAKP